MIVLSYPLVWFPVLFLVAVLATVSIPLFAFLWLVLLLVAALVTVVAAGWGVVAGVRAAGRLLLGRLASASADEPRRAGRSVSLRR